MVMDGEKVRVHWVRVYRTTRILSMLGIAHIHGGKLEFTGLAKRNNQNAPFWENLVRIHYFFPEGARACSISFTRW